VPATKGLFGGRKDGLVFPVQKERKAKHASNLTKSDYYYNSPAHSVGFRGVEFVKKVAAGRCPVAFYFELSFHLFSACQGGLELEEEEVEKGFSVVRLGFGASGVGPHVHHPKYLTRKLRICPVPHPL